jgi:hypothetical protein
MLLRYGIVYLISEENCDIVFEVFALAAIENKKHDEVLFGDINKMIYVFTAIFGGYDKLKLQPEQTAEVKFVCFADDKLEFEDGAEEQWTVIKYNPFRHLHPRMQAKYFRTHPEEIAR